MPKKMKGKEWFQILAPKIFKGKVVGEALVSDPKEAVSRSMVINYTQLDGHPSKYYVKISLVGDSMEDGKIRMRYDGHECQRDYISQMVRKRAMRIDNILPVETKDGRKMVIKTIGISLTKTKTSIKRKLRGKIGEIITARVKEMKFDEVVKSVLHDELQKNTRKEVSKIYPITRFEVRKVEVLK